MYDGGTSAFRRLARAGVALFLSRTIYRGGRRILDSFTSAFWARRLAASGRRLRVQAGVRIEYPGLVTAGSHCTIMRGSQIDSEGPHGTLTLGSTVQINSNVRLDHTGDIVVGDRTLISDGAIILTHSHGLNPRSTPTPLSKEIGCDVWIGANAIVLEKCRRIGDHAIVAAGAVVTKDVPDSHVAYGNPCRLMPRKDMASR